MTSATSSLPSSASEPMPEVSASEREDEGRARPGSFALAFDRGVVDRWGSEARLPPHVRAVVVRFFE